MDIDVHFSSIDVASAVSDSPEDRSELWEIPEASFFTGMIPEGKLSLIGHFLDVD